jgi:hypothetical protein
LIQILTEYAGEKFEMTWEDDEMLYFVYPQKDMKDGTRIRKKCQEFPGIRLDAAIHAKNLIGI